MSLPGERSGRRVAVVSIAIPIPELGETMARYTWCYAVTVGEHGRAHVVAVTPRLDSGTITAQAGRSALTNATARPHVVLVFPPLAHDEMSLIVDATFDPGDGDSDVFSLRPTNATLHRPAPR
jgi:hypothetical protein